MKTFEFMFTFKINIQLVPKLSANPYNNIALVTLLPGGNSFRQPKNVVRILTLVNILQMS